MVYAPETIVRVLRNVPLDSTYKDTIDFLTPEAQAAYFQTKQKYAFTDFTYQRNEVAVRVPVQANDLYDCNYIMYKNSSFGLKWFYAFIKRVEYINDEMSYIYFELDVMQTWWFDITVMPSFVEREHVNDDTVGAHLIDEGLALGEYITNDSTFVSLSEFYIVVGSTVNLTNGNYPPAGGNTYGGIYSGVRFYVYNNAAALEGTLEDLADKGKADAIVSMFLLPYNLAPKGTTSGLELPTGISDPANITVPTNRTLGGYTPRNNKLYTYPYQALLLSNNEGNSNILNWEFFSTGAQIQYTGGTQPNSRAIAYPINYKGVPQNVQEAVVVGNFPQCCWTKNVYANWLAAQSIRWGYQGERAFRNQTTSLVGQGVSNYMNNPTMSGVLPTIGAAANYVNSALDFQSRLAEEKEVHSIIPNSVQGTIGNGYTNVSIRKYGFLLEAKSIRAEIAASIDGYFDMFGYKVNSLKTPNITGRPSWNYVKTINASIVGSAPVDAISTIRGIFDRGVTFWHGDFVGDYQMPNTAMIHPNPPGPNPDPTPDPPPTPPPEPTVTWGVPFTDWASHVTSEFGPRINPVTGQYENHDGIDIAYPTGTGIAAIAKGECIRNTSSAGRGLYVSVQVDSQYLYIYQHCSQINVQVGDPIAKGDPIALVGATGQVTGPHLHLEIWSNGTPVNPRPFLEGKYNG